MREEDMPFSPGYLDVEQLLVGRASVEASTAPTEPQNQQGDVSGATIGDAGEHLLAGIYSEPERGDAIEHHEDIAADGDHGDGLLGGELGVTATMATTTSAQMQEGEDLAHFAQYQYQELDLGRSDEAEMANVSFSSLSPTRLSPRRLSPRLSPRRTPSATPTSPTSPKSPKSPPPLESEHHHVQTMADVGHKAAKGLQTAKNWLFSASKTLARDVQSRIEAHKEKNRKDSGGNPHQGGQHRRRPSIIESPLSDFVPEEHHQMWAQQLVHAPPETQAAALEAMEDYDRLAVQQVIDEMIWYENKRRERSKASGDLDTITPGPGLATASTAETASTVHKDLLHPARPPPPAPTVVSTPSAPPAPEESFDLLNLDGSPPAQGVPASDPATNLPTPVSVVDQAPEPSFHSRLQPTPSPSMIPPSPDRAQLKASRLAREQKRVDDKVAMARDQATRDASEKQEKVVIREQLRSEIDAWTSNKKDNIRSLLCTMDTVMWSGSTWKSPTVVDVMEPAQVRKWYMKANLVVHPDKVKQSHGSLEQLARAEMIFDVLKSAWGKFQ